MITSEIAYIHYLKNSNNSNYEVRSEFNPSRFDSRSNYNENLMILITSPDLGSLKVYIKENQLELTRYLKSLDEDDLVKRVNHPLLEKNIEEFYEFMVWHINHYTTQITDGIRQKSI